MRTFQGYFKTESLEINGNSYDVDVDDCNDDDDDAVSIVVKKV